MKISEFDYQLPPGYIAQHPLENRDSSRLMVLNRNKDFLEHRRFRDLVSYCEPGDVLVVNDSRVIAGRLVGRKVKTGGQVEILLLEQINKNRWRAMVGGRRLKSGTRIELLTRDGNRAEVRADVAAELDASEREIEFSSPIEDYLDEIGRTPLPPYIKEKLEDPERYQTIFARPIGSAAAPTAGLHFSPEVLFSLREKGVLIETVTLHVGLDTFNPLHVQHVADHPMHSEWARLSTDSARRINEARLAGGRIIAVGTTSVRVLETAALRSAGVQGTLAHISSADAAGEKLEYCAWRPVMAFEGKTDLYIYPGYRFRVVDQLITNFHLPNSTLILLVSAFTGRDRLLDAYQVAVDEGYRFYSFGDAMLIC